MNENQHLKRIIFGKIAATFFALYLIKNHIGFLLYFICKLVGCVSGISASGVGVGGLVGFVAATVAFIGIIIFLTIKPQNDKKIRIWCTCAYAAILIYSILWMVQFVLLKTYRSVFMYGIQSIFALKQNVFIVTVLFISYIFLSIFFIFKARKM